MIYENTEFFPGVTCPTCRSARTSVKNSRHIGQTIRRDRQCKSCGERFFTRELTEDVLCEIDGLDEYMVDPNGHGTLRYPAPRSAKAPNGRY